MVVSSDRGSVLVVLGALGAVTTPAGADINAGESGVAVGVASGTGRFEMYGKGPDTFSAVSSLTGTFLTMFGGESSAGTGTVPGGECAATSSE